MFRIIFRYSFSPGLVDCRQPYGALETSHYRSYITRLTAAILPCFHFNHERSCVWEQRGSAMLNPLKTVAPKCTLRCLMCLLNALYPSAALRMTHCRVWHVLFRRSARTYFVLQPQMVVIEYFFVFDPLLRPEGLILDLVQCWSVLTASSDNKVLH